MAQGVKQIGHRRFRLACNDRNAGVRSAAPWRQQVAGGTSQQPLSLRPARNHSGIGGVVGQYWRDPGPPEPLFLNLLFLTILIR